MNSYFQGSPIRKISFYLDRKPLGALVMLENLKSWLQLTARERKSLAFLRFAFHFRVLQFIAMHQQEVIERAEFLMTFSNLRGANGRNIAKLEVRFDTEVISSEWMGDINRMFQSLLETEHLGQMTFSELQV